MRAETQRRPGGGRGAGASKNRQGSRHKTTAAGGWKNLASDDRIEAACDIDRRFFEDHPGETSYWRSAIAGEFGETLEATACVAVLVRQVAPGIRVRAPFLRTAGGLQ